MRRLASSSLALLLAACAPASAPTAVVPAGPEPRITEDGTGVTFRLRNEDTGAAHRVDAPAEVVRAALPGVFAALGITEAGSDPAGRVFGSRRITAPRVAGERTSAWVRCGVDAGAGPSAGTRYRVALSVLVALRPEGSGTWVTTQVGGSATPVEGTSTAAVACVSNGRLEQRVAQELAARLAGAAPSARAR